MQFRYHGTSFEIGKKLIGANPGAEPAGGNVGYMFPALASDGNARLPEDSETIANLRILGASMAAASSNTTSLIPAIFTYFGQFIDHDIALTNIPGGDQIQMETFKTIAPQDVAATIANQRTGAFDLDSVYGEPARREDDGMMRLGQVVEAPFGSIPTNDRLHDFDRMPLISNPQTKEEKFNDRRALIGDHRNDENLIVAQLHVAFLRSHNALVAGGMSFDEARAAITRRYQLAVWNDFLPRVCDETILNKVKRDGPLHLRPDPSATFMPLEFSAAAYRFGHSLVRQDYFHNRTFDPTDFHFLFTFTALSGDLSPSNGQNPANANLPDNWIIEWKKFFPSNGSLQNFARKIDTILAPELAALRDNQGIPENGFMSQLATRNLLRGYQLSLPTGQAVANTIGAPVLSGATLLSVLPDAVRETLDRSGLSNRTPLWLYILAEAGASLDGFPNGETLGPVGSTIVAETFWNLMKSTPGSILNDDTADPSAPGTLEDLIRIGMDSSFG